MAEPARINATRDPDTTPDMHPRVRAFLARGDHSPAALDEFFSGLETPLAQPGALTFLWRGEAGGVALLRWIYAGVDNRAFERVKGSDLWHLRIPVTDGGRFEYKLAIEGPHGPQWILDPRNPHVASDPFGNNSVAMTHGYSRPDWSIRRGAPRGMLETAEIPSATFAMRRTEQVYLPYGYDPAAEYPLLIVHDGGDYDAYADLTVALDNLIAAKDIPPVIAVLSNPGDRMNEYPRGRRHARYVTGELLPYVEKRYAVSRAPARRVLLGASLGAVASLSIAFRFPGVFGGLILKSGSFILDPDKLRGRDHPVFHRVAALIRAIERAPTPPFTRAFVSTGELEGLADQSRALAAALSDRGVSVRFRSSWDGHHWHNWRDQLRDALMWVLSTGVRGGQED